jgi:diguanylate cyclase (GGDEF)-like protein
MELKRYKLFLQVLREESDFGMSLTGLDVYRRAAADWHGGDETVVNGDVLKRNLENTLMRGSHWRLRNGVEAFFPVPIFQAVIITKSSSPTRKTTRDRIQKLLSGISKRANIAFDATYDGLTGVLNSRSLEEKIRDAIGIAARPIDSADAEIKPIESVALIALDLDHFKQVNDSYGHAYGDLVLRCFAHRLETTTDALQQEMDGAVRLEVGRSGGEEFVIVASGDLSPQRVKDLAERIRISISGRELPTEEEWASSSGSSPSVLLPLPHVSERKVTTSVGLSSFKPRAAENVTGIVSELRREADAALYRAKAGGRNTVRYFPEIRDRFGTVIEHHSETNIVTVDIGSQVNVKIGQEFHVYHPDFTGEKGFIYSDGRSKKRLGTYPRFSSGRIVVFDVQLEISFCTVAEKILERFPPGSGLEQIPLGSIYHLVSAEAKASVVIASQAAELDAYVEMVVKRAARPIAAVFSLRNMPILEKARGTAFVNRALASLFEEVRRGFPLPAKVCQIESDKIAVAAQIGQKAPYHELIQKVIDSAAQKMSNLVEFTAGVFTTGVKADPLEGDQSVLDPTKALSYARYAAVVLSWDEKPVELFTASTANAILARHRSQKTYVEAFVDYEALHNLGIEYFKLENQVALCALEAGKGDFALAHIQRAIVLQPSIPPLKANLGYIQFAFGQPLEAHESFVQFHAEHPEFKLESVYIAPEALAAYASFIEKPSSIDRSTVTVMLENASTLAAPNQTAWRERIRLALNGISTLPTTPSNSAQPEAKPNPDIAQMWTKLLEAIGRASAFTRTYLIEARPISFENGVFTLGFTAEFEDHIPLVDNARNHALIITKFRELGFEVAGVKFVVH